jgi:hypothetical protein
MRKYVLIFLASTLSIKQMYAIFAWIHKTPMPVATLLRQKGSYFTQSDIFPIFNLLEV